MFFSKVKILFSYVLVMVAGLLIGYAIINLPRWLKSPYTEGDYAQYFPNPDIKVLVYGTQNCPFCIKTRDLLTTQRIQFEDFDIDKLDKARQEFLKLGGEGVPLIIIGNRRIEGFNQAQIEAAVAALKLPKTKR
ncbi:glutaredoxin family protein [Undibacterium flavidum]|uniref:Glutaredoxin family protein n=1 Tax=Undibacterium flavidum TaxID=2762297 RepID=A0ABR6YC56_9BURK|nr:glutaredoxin domain-containing protein [Undibacterium flavidum]MBC3874129.1 glutaredoxin family protein [Undibacterium flavidum]